MKISAVSRFIMLSITTNIYNKKTKGLTLMELFTTTGKVKKNAALKNIVAPMLARVWQELEYRIGVCRITRGANIERL
jgi:hypothetical protein